MYGNLLYSSFRAHANSEMSQNVIEHPLLCIEAMCEEWYPDYSIPIKHDDYYTEACSTDYAKFCRKETCLRVGILRKIFQFCLDFSSDVRNWTFELRWLLENCEFHLWYYHKTIWSNIVHLDCVANKSKMLKESLVAYIKWINTIELFLLSLSRLGLELLHPKILPPHIISTRRISTYIH